MRWEVKSAKTYTRRMRHISLLPIRIAGAMCSRLSKTRRVLKFTGRSGRSPLQSMSERGIARRKHIARQAAEKRWNRPLRNNGAASELRGGGQRRAWPEIANFWPSITRRDAPLCCKRRGQRGDSTSPAVGRRFVPHTAAMTCPPADAGWGGQRQIGAPGWMPGFFRLPVGGMGDGQMRRSYSNVQTVVRNTSWFVSKLILRRHTVRLSALAAAGLLRAAKGSSFSNISLLIIREGKSDRRAVNRVLLVGAAELLRGKADRPRECASAGRP